MVESILAKEQGVSIEVLSASVTFSVRRRVKVPNASECKSVLEEAVKTPSEHLVSVTTLK